MEQIEVYSDVNIKYLKKFPYHLLDSTSVSDIQKIWETTFHETLLNAGIKGHFSFSSLSREEIGYEVYINNVMCLHSSVGIKPNLEKEVEKLIASIYEYNVCDVEHCNSICTARDLISGILPLLLKKIKETIEIAIKNSDMTVKKSLKNEIRSMI